MEFAKVYIKSNKQKVIESKSPWIFSGAIERIENYKHDGQPCKIFYQKRFIGIGYVNKTSDIMVRVFEYNDINLNYNYFYKKILNLKKIKESLISDNTNTYRLINGEGDFLPGLIVDVYGEYIVFQSHTAGIDFFKDMVIRSLVSIYNPKGIYEKSDSITRKHEGVDKKSGALYGNIPEEIEIYENGYKFIVSFNKSQKTGFFIDQRENREIFSKYAKDKTILNAFSYTAAFGVYAYKNGASKVVNVDTDSQALEIGKKNYLINNIKINEDEFIEEDCKDYLREMPYDYYDLIILDPPKFAKSRKNIDNAIKGYKYINKMAMQKIKSGGIIFTFSCSGVISLDLFRMIIFYAAKEAKRNVKILKRLSASSDHSISVFHKEGEYLKGFILYVE